MKDLGTATFLLGIGKGDMGGGGLLLLQNTYALEVVQRYGMGSSKAVSTPFEPGSHLGVGGCPQIKGERNAVEGIPYGSLVESLMYLAICTRPDLAM